MPNNKSDDTSTLCVKLKRDVRAKLEEWSDHNLTSLGAELNRAVREKAQREAETTTAKAVS